MSQDVSYQVELEVYTGPFDLLLKAIDDNEIDIFRVSLSHITATYFDYWKRMEPPLVLAADFLIMAAYLLEMKSKSMLPQNDEIIIAEEDEENIESTLLAHLQEYEFYKNVALTLKEKKQMFERVYSRHEGEAQEREFELVDVSLKDLILAFNKVYKEAQKRDRVVAIKDEEITLEKKLTEIKALLTTKEGVIKFEEMFVTFSRIEIVVTFLAILELAKQNLVRIMQDAKFGNIFLTRKGEQSLGG